MPKTTIADYGGMLMTLSWHCSPIAGAFFQLTESCHPAKSLGAAGQLQHKV
jgi:hypothetical protein